MLYRLHIFIEYKNYIKFKIISKVRNKTFSRTQHIIYYLFIVLLICLRICVLYLNSGKQIQMYDFDEDYRTENHDQSCGLYCGAVCVCQSLWLCMLQPNENGNLLRHIVPVVLPNDVCMNMSVVFFEGFLSK